MCLAIPARVIELYGDTAVVDVDGIRRECSLVLAEDAAVGAYVIVHAGFALHVIDETVAMESLRLLREAGAATDGEAFDASEPSG
ncbi:MAG: HypC/HybG/HupF family hydrogenase formation chaperone [Desulfococcus multivorans]|jgi:hydrogenase expression/formation protein HypC|nr:HypC/HybG/HupF family hydrogenase formation chaperone [Desulfococcus multivorans]